MTEQTEGAEVEMLAEIIWGILPAGTSRMGMKNAAREVLASDWLAAREAAAEVRGAQAVLAAVEGAYDPRFPAIEERLAKAWQEGWSAGASRRASTDNPYRPIPPERTDQ